MLSQLRPAPRAMRTPCPQALWLCVPGGSVWRVPRERHCPVPSDGGPAPVLRVPLLQSPWPVTPGTREGPLRCSAPTSRQPCTGGV